MAAVKAISILGSTGSIGTSTLDVVARFPEQFQVVALAAGRNTERLAQQVRRFRPRLVAVADAAAAADLGGRLGDVKPEIAWGSPGMEQVATVSEADLVVAAVVGTAGLVPTLAALTAGKDVALANKETLVAAGAIMTRQAREQGVRLLPVDSEHNAIFQCLQGARSADVRRLVLTASGGPFRGFDRQQLARVTCADALRHPRWDMGPKVTIDSSTLMNKALEMIEAHWLFGVPMEQIDVLIHPESIVHSLVEFNDGSVLAQLGVTDMRLPIQYALSYPQRLPGFLPALDLAQWGALNFAAPDEVTFPSLNYARQAIKIGGTLPTAMNAANEVAVECFRAGQISFEAIFTLIERVMQAHNPIRQPELAEILAVDASVRQQTWALALN